jgi:glycerol-3-phosphate dehydrogenase
MGFRGPAALAAGMGVFHALAADRNDGVSRHVRMPRSGLLGRRRLAAEHPMLAGTHVNGGAYWYDGQMLDAARLTLECVRDAVDAGAVAANHVACIALLNGNGRIRGAVVRDALSGKEFEVRAALTVNATGPWVDQVLETGPRTLQRARTATWTVNMNLVTRRLFEADAAVGVTSSRPSDASIGTAKRLFFASPWHGCTVVGTTHEIHVGGPDAVEVTDDAVGAFLQEVREAAPGLGLEPSDVRSVHVGLTPAEDVEHERARRPLLVDHQALDDVAGLISVAGIKFTTAPAVAAKAVELAMKMLRRHASTLHFGRRGSGSPAEVAPAGYEASEAEWARRIYGARAVDCLGERLEGDAGSSDDVFRRRVAYGIENEMVVRVADAVLRATDWAERGRLTGAQLDWCVDALGTAFRWSEERSDRERAETRARLQRLKIRLGD